MTTNKYPETNRPNDISMPLCLPVTGQNVFVPSSFSALTSFATHSDQSSLPTIYDRQREYIAAAALPSPTTHC